MELTINHQNPFKKKKKDATVNSVKLNIDPSANIKSLRTSILTEKKHLNIKCRASSLLPTIYKLYTFDSKAKKMVPLYQYKSILINNKKKKSTILLKDILPEKNAVVYCFKGKYNYRMYYGENNMELTKLYGGNYKGHNASQAANKAYNRMLKIIKMDEKYMNDKQKKIFDLLKKNYKKKDNVLNFSLINKDKIYDFKCSQVEMKKPVKYVIYPAETPKNKRLDREEVLKTTVKDLHNINPLFKLREIVHRNKLTLLRT